MKQKTKNPKEKKSFVRVNPKPYQNPNLKAQDSKRLQMFSGKRGK
jgi:hypothetical protein